MITAKQILGIKDEAALRALARAQAKKVGADLAESAVPLAAYLNHGRWIADCPCGAGVACDPDLTIAVCLTHRDPDDPTLALSTLVHTAIVWPAKRAKLEALLRKRTQNKHRNWRPGETEADLERENAAHGVKE